MNCMIYHKPQRKQIFINIDALRYSTSESPFERPANNRQTPLNHVNIKRQCKSKHGNIDFYPRWGAIPL